MEYHHVRYILYSRPRPILVIQVYVAAPYIPLPSVLFLRRIMDMDLLVVISASIAYGVISVVASKCKSHIT